eukprot:768467-Hanusia_phi.AAC.2
MLAGTSAFSVPAAALLAPPIGGTLRSTWALPCSCRQGFMMFRSSTFDKLIRPTDGSATLVIKARRSVWSSWMTRNSPLLQSCCPSLPTASFLRLFLALYPFLPQSFLYFFLLRCPCSLSCALSLPSSISSSCVAPALFHALSPAIT